MKSNIRLKDIIQPYFAVDGKNIKRPIKSMPGINHLSVDNLVKEAKEVRNRGIGGILLFGVAKSKDKNGRNAYKSSGIVQKAVQEIKRKVKALTIITDVCLCGYTSHGHCRIFKAQSPNIDKDATLKALAKIAVSHAEAGADFVAPSAMMNGQVKTIREELDKNGFKNTKILAYSAKYASNFYAPFREALNSAPKFGDRSSYQLDYRNSDAALVKIKQDIKEGADMVMVKPALSYLDIVYKTKKEFRTPLVAYSVSGEYTMIKKIAAGKEDEKGLILEALNSIKRAGADFIITYWGREVSKWLKQ